MKHKKKKYETTSRENPLKPFFHPPSHGYKKKKAIIKSARFNSAEIY